MYRDLVLPVKQALLETSRGLSLLTQAAQGSHQQRLETLVLRLAAFPRFPGMHLRSLRYLSADAGIP